MPASFHTLPFLTKATGQSVQDNWNGIQKSKCHRDESKCIERRNEEEISCPAAPKVSVAIGKKRVHRDSPCFRDPLRPILNPSPSPPSSGASDPIFVAIPLDLLREKRVMTQKANVSHGKAMVGEMARWGGLPCVRRSRSMYKQ
ncbi:hypothetical protein [Absidia glauca]|uniref:Uncharacterized protein n=1 Tax=Absidia glauca TaxID=4829 RepID=A0A168NXF3_ABSGL|nr:hypothetical protein [Absidia glauca]